MSNEQKLSVPTNPPGKQFGWTTAPSGRRVIPEKPAGAVPEAGKEINAEGDVSGTLGATQGASGTLGATKDAGGTPGATLGATL
jgi:hypothetical protein